MPSKKFFLQNIIVIFLAFVAFISCSKRDVKISADNSIARQQPTYNNAYAPNYNYQRQYYQQYPYGSRVVVPNSRAYNNPYDFQPNEFRDNDQDYIVPQSILNNDRSLINDRQ